MYDTIRYGTKTTFAPRMEHTGSVILSGTDEIHPYFGIIRFFFRIIIRHKDSTKQDLPPHMCLKTWAYSTAHTQLDNARESRSIPVRVSPACSRVSPAWSRVSPACSRVSPACSRVSPACSRVSPACNRVSPACSRVSPACNRVSLARSRVSPRAYDFELPVLYISMKRISQYL